MGIARGTVAAGYPLRGRRIDVGRDLISDLSPFEESASTVAAAILWGRTDGPGRAGGLCGLWCWVETQPGSQMGRVRSPLSAGAGGSIRTEALGRNVDVAVDRAGIEVCWPRGGSSRPLNSTFYVDEGAAALRA